MTTSVLHWEKPKRRVSKEAWKEEYGFEDGPTGGFQPNMSEEDAQSWKAKITGTKLGYPQVEIRKSAGGSLMLIIVNLGAGYNYKNHRSAPDFDEASKMVAYHAREKWGKPGTVVDINHEAISQHLTEGINIHISMNGPSLLTFQDMTDMQTAIAEAKAKLEELEGVSGERGIFYVETKTPDDTEEKLRGIKGVRVLYRMDSIKLIAISAPWSLLEEVADRTGSRSIKPRERMLKEARRAVYGKDYA